MIDRDETRLKALFATAPEVGDDAAFVRGIAMRTGALRRRWRNAIAVVWVSGIVLLAALLAPYAPIAGATPDLPSLTVPVDIAASASQRGAELLAAAASLPAWWYYVLTTCTLPMLLAAWLVVAGRRAG